MAGVNDRVKDFIHSWPILKKQLEEVLKDDEGLFHSDGVSRSLWGESDNE